MFCWNIFTALVPHSLATRPYHLAPLIEWLPLRKFALDAGQHGGVIFQRESKNQNGLSIPSNSLFISSRPLLEVSQRVVCRRRRVLSRQVHDSGEKLG